MAQAYAIRDSDVLVVVDVQNDFCPSGALAVPRGDEVAPIVNYLAEKFKNVVLTQDWHPPGHQSFASSHPGHSPYDTITVAYGPTDPLARPLRAGNARRCVSRRTADSPCWSDPAQGNSSQHRFVFHVL